MDKLKLFGLWPSGRNLRRHGFWVALLALAFASLIGTWVPGFLFGLFLLGMGIGLGDWEMEGGEI